MIKKTMFLIALLPSSAIYAKTDKKQEITYAIQEKKVDAVRSLLKHNTYTSAELSTFIGLANNLITNAQAAISSQKNTLGLSESPVKQLLFFYLGVKNIQSAISSTQTIDHLQTLTFSKTESMQKQINDHLLITAISFACSSACFYYFQKTRKKEHLLCQSNFNNALAIKLLLEDAYNQSLTEQYQQA